MLKTHTPLIALSDVKSVKKHGPKVKSRITVWGRVLRHFLHKVAARFAAKVFKKHGPFCCKNCSSKGYEKTCIFCKKAERWSLCLQNFCKQYFFRVDFCTFKNHAPHFQFCGNGVNRAGEIAAFRGLALVILEHFWLKSGKNALLSAVYGAYIGAEGRDF